jgi:serine/threonine protein kinase
MTNAIQPGQFWLEYREEIGSGGLGRVNRVTITQSLAGGIPAASEWAVKRLNTRWQQNPVAQQRFEREIAALAIMSHPNIVMCAGVSLPGQERFYMMPLYRDSLRRLIARQGFRGDWRAIATYGAILADALEYAHAMGFIHRDVKPDNILFNPGGPLVLTDWGIGYFIHQHSVVLQQLTRGGMGTQYYCSPEQWATGKCDARGDIYSLGMTLEEWLNGCQRHVAVGRLTNPATIDGHGMRALRDLLQRMTRVDVRNRPGSMTIVSRELREIAGLH